VNLGRTPDSEWHSYPPSGHVKRLKKGWVWEQFYVFSQTY